MRIAIIGGTGKEGRGLALRWARAGHAVCIGSRDADRAADRALELSELGVGRIEGASNEAALAGADVVTLCVPYNAHPETLEALRSRLDGKLLIDLTVPLRPPAVTRVHLPAGQSAALEAQALLGPGVRVVAALHHISSMLLADPARAIDCDVLVCADDEQARSTAIALVGDLGMRGLDAGPLANAVALEALTPVLLHLNRRYKVGGVGVRFTGLEAAVPLPGQADG